MKGFRVIFPAICLFFLSSSKANADVCIYLLSAVGQAYTWNPSVVARIQNPLGYPQYLSSEKGPARLAASIPLQRIKAISEFYKSMAASFVPLIPPHTSKISLLKHELLKTVEQEHISLTAIDFFFYLSSIAKKHLPEERTDIDNMVISLILEHQPVLFDILLAEIMVADPLTFAQWEYSLTAPSSPAARSNSSLFKTVLTLGVIGGLFWTQMRTADRVDALEQNIQILRRENEALMHNIQMQQRWIDFLLKMKGVMPVPEPQKQPRFLDASFQYPN